MTAATGKPPEGEKKGKDKEKKDLPPCKVSFFAPYKSIKHILGGGQKASSYNGC